MRVPEKGLSVISPGQKLRSLDSFGGCESREDLGLGGVLEIWVGQEVRDGRNAGNKTIFLYFQQWLRSNRIEMAVWGPGM